jgi:hypothetical protein
VNSQGYIDCDQPNTQNSTLKKATHFIKTAPDINLLHGRSGVRRQPSPKSLRVPRLHKDCTRSCKFTHQPFARVHIRQYTTRGDPLEDVFAIPRNQVSIVDDVLFVFLKLSSISTKDNHTRGEKGNGKLTSFRMIAPKLVHHRIP